VCPVHRQGIIFLILNYNHIKATLRAADSSVAQRISSASGSSGSGSKGAQQQQQQQPAAPGTAAGGLGSAGAAAIKECEVRRHGIAANHIMCHSMFSPPRAIGVVLCSANASDQHHAC
jgi:hypothetical protein